MECRCAVEISQISADDWNALIQDQSPFVRHEFLAALEACGCVSADNGWLAHHILCYQGEELIGAMPFYIKAHSYGEYIFDWAWADAYHRHGFDYYPKGLAAIPFTPASANKLLIKNTHDTEKVRQALIKHSLEIAQSLNLSSVHALFLDDSQLANWQQLGFSPRSSFQFHWRNQGYQNFADYLSTFSSSKRKKIRQQRRSIDSSPVKFKRLEHDQITKAHWQHFYQFYLATTESHFANAYLNQAFFLKLGETMADQILMIAAYIDDQNIASALFFKSDSKLFGRYWGSSQYVKNLHFETCYYQAIEYCIENNIETFEAGAQGEHKLSRGLTPVCIKSAHWLAHPQFYQAVKDHIDSEAQQVEAVIKHLNQHSPFKQP